MNERDLVKIAWQERDSKDSQGSNGWIASSMTVSRWTLVPPWTMEDGGCLHDDPTPVDGIRGRQRRNIHTNIPFLINILSLSTSKTIHEVTLPPA